MPLFNSGPFGSLFRALRGGIFNFPPDTGNGGPYPPPQDDIRITDAGDIRVTDSGDTRIVNIQTL